MFDPYELFGLSPTDATLSELKTAYYRFALLCHPDKGGDAQSMAKVTLAYQWIRDSLQTVQNQRTHFETDYDEAIVPSFTDVLAETFNYTLERFRDLCYLHGITTPELIQMLHVPAFESAMVKHATPETLDAHLHTFLESYVRDTASSASASNVEYYVPMSEPTGYDVTVPWKPEDFQRTAVVLYQELVCPDAATPFASIDTTTPPPSDFTHTVRPLPMNDYREAFMSNVYPIHDAAATATLQDAYEQKRLERATQDLSLNASFIE